MGLRAKVGWVLHGHDNTMRTLDALSADLRQLQERVDALTKVDVPELRERQLLEFEAVRNAVINVTDDLAARIAALQPPETPPT